MTSPISAKERFCQAIPKTELHLHLDGSLPISFIHQQAQQHNIDLPCPIDQLQNFLYEMKRQIFVNKDYKTEAKGNWPIFDFCNQFLQTREGLEEATEKILGLMHERDNVWLVELRFCPVLHQLKGLTLDEVMGGVIAGMERSKAKYPNLVAGIIICVLRSYPIEHGIEMVNLAEKYLNKGVVGIDIAGDEGSYPLQPLLPVLQLAKSKSIPITCHAGEVVITEGPNSTIKNCQIALEGGASRLGHAIVLPHAPELLNQIKQTNVGLELCITGNVHGGRATFKSHPVHLFFKEGVKICVNCDNLLLSGDVGRDVTPTGEIHVLLTEVGMKVEDVKLTILNGVKMSFCKYSEDWLRRLQEEVERVVRSHPI